MVIFETRNWPRNFFFTGRFEFILVSLRIWRSQLFNDTKIRAGRPVKNQLWGLFRLQHRLKKCGIIVRLPHYVNIL